MIVFDEYSYAEELVNTEITSTHNAIRKGALLAKLYLRQGKTDEEIIELLNEKFHIFNSSSNNSIKTIKIQKMLLTAKKNPCLDSRPIDFSFGELRYIKEVCGGSIRLEQTFFIMLCLSKFYKNNFYFTIKEICDLSKTKSKSRHLEKLIRNKHFFVEEKPLKSNKRIRKLFFGASQKTLDQYDPEDIAFTIVDYNNLVNYYIDFVKNTDKTDPKTKK